MSEKARVHFFPLPEGDGLNDHRSQLPKITTRLLGAQNLNPDGADRWGMKVQLGRPGWPAVIEGSWVKAAKSALMGKTAFAFDTLSITEEGLHEVPVHLETAHAKGFDRENLDLEYIVADDPELGESQVLDPDFRLSAGAESAGGMITLSVPKPHPHLGYAGAVADLGLGLGDREGTLRLHRDVRPKVDTPLCAGCGPCLTVCLFDAIHIKGGRATIDHQRCTGCGECMSVCHMAGISVEEAARLSFYQGKVATAAASFVQAKQWQQGGKSAHISYLVQLDRWHKTASRRKSGCPKQLGVMASTDPVALDQAVWDAISEACGGQLSTWSGYNLDPEVLLQKAQELGLGNRQYQLVTVGDSTA